MLEGTVKVPESVFQVFLCLGRFVVSPSQAFILFHFPSDATSMAKSLYRGHRYQRFLHAERHASRQ